MLPSKGYFNDIECPYLENTCGRPYCHFNHRKKQQESVNEVPPEKCSSKIIPTYKPTPKSELAVRKSHIPISYVPDVYKVEKSTTRSFRNNTVSDIVYKPTPISLLNSAVKSSTNNDKSISSIGNDILESKYVPETGVKGLIKNEKIINDYKDEYKPEEQEIEYQYNPSSHKDVTADILSDIVYRPNSSDINTLPNVEYTPSACSYKNSSLNFENLDNEFEMIDEVINTSDITKKSGELDDAINQISREELIRKNGETTSDSNSETERVSDTKDKVQQSVDQEKLRSSQEVRTRGSTLKESSKKDRKGDDKEKHRNKKEKRSSEEAKKDRKRDEKKDKKEERKEKGEKNGRKVEDTKRHEKNKNEHSKSRDKDKRDDKSIHKDLKRRSSTKKEFNDKSRHKESEKINGKTHSSHKERDKSKNSKNKTNKHEHDKRPNKNEVKKRESFTSEFDKTRPTDEIEDTSIPSTEFNYDIDADIDEKQTMEECFRIFNEYKPTVEQPIEEETIPNKNEMDMGEEALITKKRIAHSNASNSSTKFQPPKPIPKPTPGQVMANRLKMIKAAQADNEEKLISNELKNIAKRPPPSQIFKPAKKIKMNETKRILPPPPHASLIDDIINRSNNKPTFKKIAPVSNVMNIQKAKANLKVINNKQATEQMNKTIAQTNKTGKRQAHVPDYSLSDIPDVIDVDKSKLPVNVRSRFLTLLADECCKLYLTQKDAYKRALDEEYSCYQKCKVLVTYRNSAMLAVNRLRKEVKDREEKDLGLIGSDDSSQAKKDDAEKKILYTKIQQYVLSNEELDIHGYPRESDIPGRAFIKNRKTSSIVPLPKNQKKCCRCSKIYLIDDDGKAIYEEECLYHPLRKRTIKGEHIYLCCKSSDDSGCATCHTHVSEMPEDAELEGFQTTLPPNGDNDPRSNAVYALDCEMCYTTKGLELTRVTVIDTNCKTVYESLVKPLNDITDYNTRFSGITKQHMDKTSTGILQVQANILHLCNSNTILIGHSLESDMKALKIIHSTIVDTAVLFPHKMGLPHKRALRTLACDYLKKIIQNDVGGHDSAEDAITCMELIKWKVKEDSKFRS